MQPPRQPGLFFWQLGRAPGRVLGFVARTPGAIFRSARRLGWEVRRFARHSAWAAQKTAKDAGRATREANWALQKQARQAGWEARRKAKHAALAARHSVKGAGRAAREANWALQRQARHAGWEARRRAKHAALAAQRSAIGAGQAAQEVNWSIQQSSRDAGWGLKRSVRVMANFARTFLPFWRPRLADNDLVPDQPSFAHALARMQQHELGVRSIINIGAGSGADSVFVQRAWPDARTLLIEMDDSYEPHYLKLKSQLPDLAWSICAAGPSDSIGRMQKSDIGGVGGAIDLTGEAGGGAAIQFKRIDTLAREHGLEGPFFLRFDTHGFELDVLAGATETLKQTALIMMEVYNFKLRFTGNKNLTFDEMSLHMKSIGFRCVDICDPMHRPGDLALWQMHLFFIRDDHPLWADSSYSKQASARNI